MSLLTKVLDAAKHGHHPFGPSSLHRRLACPGSLAAEIDIPEESSVYADEGTFAHDLLAQCLEEGTDADSKIGTVSGCCRFTWSEEDATHGQVYLNTIRELMYG
jgi:hypothetical protein